MKKQIIRYISLILCCVMLCSCGNIQESSEIAVDTQEVTSSEPDDALYNVLTVSDEAVQKEFKGFGGIYYAYNYIPEDEKYGDERKYTDEMQQIELDRLVEMGNTIVRTQYSPAWAYNLEANKWDFDTDYMKGFYEYLDDMKECGFDVALNMEWSPKYIRGEKTYNNYGYNPFYILANGNPEKCDQLYYQWIVDSLEELYRRGYDNVKYVIALTEPMNYYKLKEYNEAYDLWRMYVLGIHKSLEEAGLREKVKIVGPNTGNFYPQEAEKEGITPWESIERIAADPEIIEAIDILSHHNYLTREKEANIYSEWYDYLEKCVEIADSINKPYWLDEGEFSPKGSTDATRKEDISEGYYATQLAVKMVAAMNVGTQSVLRWTLTDQYWPNNTQTGDGWLDGCHLHGILPNLLDTTIPRKSYYAYSLIAKYSMCDEGDSVIYPLQQKRGVYGTCIKLADGNISYIIVNTNAGPMDIKIKSEEKLSDGKSLYRRVFERDNTEATTQAHIPEIDTEFQNVDNYITDVIQGGSVHVYTTIK